MTHLHSDYIDTLPLIRIQEMHGLRATNAMLSERVQAAVKRATDTSEAYKVSDWSLCGMHIDPNSVLCSCYCNVSSSTPTFFPPCPLLSSSLLFSSSLPSITNPYLILISSPSPHLFLAQSPPFSTLHFLILLFVILLFYFSHSSPLLPPQHSSLLLPTAISLYHQTTPLFQVMSIRLSSVERERDAVRAVSLSCPLLYWLYCTVLISTALTCISLCCNVKCKVLIWTILHYCTVL